MFTIYSQYNVLLNYSPTAVQVIPAPFHQNQLCGVCANFDGNKRNEFLNKAGGPVAPNLLASSWCV